MTDHPLLERYIFAGYNEYWAKYIANRKAAYQRHLRRMKARTQAKRQLKLFS